jgi:hypothetical protein
VSDRVSQALTVLQEADHLVESWSCPTCHGEGSGERARCCHFGKSGHEPWLTEVEWRLLEREVARQGRSMPRVPEDGRCPFLDASALCSVYQARPLGCRTYFCDESSGLGSWPRPAISRLPWRLEELSRRPLPGDDGRARPLTTWVASRR